MKILKKLLLPLLILALALLCACTANTTQTPVPADDAGGTDAPAAADEAPVPDDAQLADDSASSPAADEAPASEQSDPIGAAGAGEVTVDDSNTGAEGSEYYFSENRIWCIQLPDSWAGKYAVEVTETGVRFYDTANDEAGAGGTLFTVCSFAKGEEYDYLPSFLVLGEDVDTTYVASYPTDVQAAEGNEELLALHESLTDGLDEWLPAHFFFVAR